MEQTKLQKSKIISFKKASFYCLIIFILSFTAGFLLQRNIFRNEKSIVNLKEENFINQELFQSVESYIKKNYIKQPVDNKILFYGAIKGMAESLDDPYSVFLDPEEMSKFLEGMAGEFQGVGMEIGVKNDVLTVIAPLDQTPAKKAGIRAGDKIYAIDKKNTSGMSPDEAATLIRGEKGTPVVLTIWRKGWEQPKDFEIIREVIKVKTVEWEMKSLPAGPLRRSESEASRQGKDVVYLKISTFSDKTWQEFKKTASEILAAKPKALILDLRNNSGGYLETAVDIAGYWTRNSIVTFSENAKGEKKEYRAKGRGEFAGLKIVVLINEGSASGAEILAGALKDYKKAVLIGETTFGKGSVQEMEAYQDGSGLKLTVAHWFTPTGSLIDEIGIKPDIEVISTFEDFNKDKDPQLEKALEIINK